MNAVFWGYRFPNMRESWSKQAKWIAEALSYYGVEVVKHPSFSFGVEEGNVDYVDYDNSKHNPADIVIYNHADISHIRGDVLPATETWFFKPTAPTKYHTTLDTLGYGAFSSVSYDEPDFRSCDMEDVQDFFNSKVFKWIDNNETKWGEFFKTKQETVKEEDYCLVLGQCGGDEVVTRHDFGGYFYKLKGVVKELVHVTDDRIVVKLHPYTDGKKPEDHRLSNNLAKDLRSISSRVSVYGGKSSIHSFIDRSKYVVLCNSGAGFEVMMHHKPMISWGYPEYHWVTYDLRHLADMVRATDLEWFDREKSDKFLYWFLEKYCFYSLETCKRRVSDLLGITNRDCNDHKGYKSVAGWHFCEKCNFNTKELGEIKEHVKTNN